MNNTDVRNHTIFQRLLERSGYDGDNHTWEFPPLFRLSEPLTEEEIELVKGWIKLYPFRAQHDHASIYYSYEGDSFRIRVIIPREGSRGFSFVYEGAI